MPIFNRAEPDASSFFLTVPDQQRGIHCRFGMAGIIAESHFDAGRNFIAMLRGRKRYILSPPGQCDKLDVMKDGPSARHSASDWTSLEGMRKIGAARALEVVLEEGDVLYVPAFWFHFIVSLTTNVQCNTRSGTPPHGLDDISACGMHPRATEEFGAFTDIVPPVHHAIAAAKRGLDVQTASELPARMLVEISDVIAANSSDGIFRSLVGSKEETPLFTAHNGEAGTFRPGASNLTPALNTRLGFAIVCFGAFLVFFAIRLRGRSTPSRRVIGR